MWCARTDAILEAMPPARSNARALYLRVMEDDWEMTMYFSGRGEDLQLDPLEISAETGRKFKDLSSHN